MVIDMKIEKGTRTEFCGINDKGWRLKFTAYDNESFKSQVQTLHIVKWWVAKSWEFQNKHTM